MKITGLNIPTLDANTVLTNGLNLVYFIAGVVAVIVLVMAGFSYTISRGEPAEITKAKNGILYSAVGLVVILSAFIITNFVIGRF